MKFIIVKRRRRSNKKRRYLYRLWQGDQIIYIGKTSQALTTVLRRHFFGNVKPYRRIDVLRVTMIEKQYHMTLADCAIYQSYYVNLYRPPYNRGMYEVDTPTINLPPCKWEQVNLEIMDRWIEQKTLMNERRFAELKERRRQWRQDTINNLLGKNLQELEQNDT